MRSRRSRAIPPALEEARHQTVSLGALETSVGYALRRAQQSVSADLIRLLEPLNLRAGQFSVLTVIGENAGISQRRICATLDIKAANFVPLFAELERRGLTRREAIDGRSWGLHLSSKGRAVLLRAQQLHEQHQAGIVARIGSTQARGLVAVLFRLAGIEADGGVAVDGVIVDGVTTDPALHDGSS